MKLIVGNFRSKESQDVELAPLTIVYGPNGAGKSSLLYALMTLKSIILNPKPPVISVGNLEARRDFSDVQIEPHPDRMPSDVLRLQGDCTKFMREIGWKPEIPRGQTWRDLLDYWRSRTAHAPRAAS